MEALRTFPRACPSRIARHLTRTRLQKTITAAAALQLAAQGKINLDDPIDQYLGNRLQNGTATIRRTLLHTACFANPNPLSWVHLAVEYKAFDCDRFVKALIKAYGRPTCKPGSRYARSNVGYRFLGELIAKVSGKRYSQFVEESVIAPYSCKDRNVWRTAFRMQVRMQAARLPAFI